MNFWILHLDDGFLRQPHVSYSLPVPCRFLAGCLPAACRLLAGCLPVALPVALPPNGADVIAAGKMKGRRFDQLAGSSTSDDVAYIKWLRDHASCVSNPSLVSLVAYLKTLN